MHEKPLSESEGTEGQRLFDAFLRENNLTLAEVAKPLGVSEVTVLNWRSGKKRPVDHQRAKIEILTDGKVPALSWRNSGECQEIDGIQPLKVAGAGAEAAA
jgi:transcriptional regulator with XRE-family HTH domain